MKIKFNTNGTTKNSTRLKSSSSLAMENSNTSVSVCSACYRYLSVDSVDRKEKYWWLNSARTLSSVFDGW